MEITEHTLYWADEMRQYMKVFSISAQQMVVVIVITVIVNDSVYV